MTDKEKFKFKVDIECENAYYDDNKPSGLMNQLFKENVPIVVDPIGKIMVPGQYKDEFTNATAKKIANLIGGAFLPGNGKPIDISEFVKGIKFLIPNVKEKYQIAFNVAGKFENLIADTSLMHRVTPKIKNQAYVFNGQLMKNDQILYFGPQNNQYNIDFTVALNNYFGYGETNVNGKKLEAKISVMNFDPQRNMEYEIKSIDQYMNNKDGMNFEYKLGDSKGLLILESPSTYTRNIGISGDLNEIDKPVEVLKTKTMIKSFVDCADNLALSFLDKARYVKADKDAKIAWGKSLIANQNSRHSNFDVNQLFE